MTQESGKTWVLQARAWTPCRVALIDLLFADLIQAEEKRKQLRRWIAQEVVSDPHLLKLIRLCELRHITVFALAAAIGDISRFRTPKQLVAYIGLHPRTHLSGQGGYTGSLAHTGRHDLRALLVQAAHAIMRLPATANRLARWGKALAYRRGNMVAVIAVARKLIVAVWFR